MIVTILRHGTNTPSPSPPPPPYPLKIACPAAPGRLLQQFTPREIALGRALQASRSRAVVRRGCMSGGRDATGVEGSGDIRADRNGGWEGRGEGAGGPASGRGGCRHDDGGRAVVRGSR